MKIRTDKALGAQHGPRGIVQGDASDNYHVALSITVTIFFPFLYVQICKWGVGKPGFIPSFTIR